MLSRHTGVVTDAGASGLKLAFGIGAYLIPIVLLVWGVSFFVRAEIHEGRTGVGLGIVVLSIISIAALTSPGQVFFSDTQVLTARGGYLGASVAWALSSIAGVTISYVLLGGLMLMGLIVTGLSITALVDLVRGRHLRAGRRRRACRARS